MKFVDTVVFRVKSGDGGKGCVSYRREKHVPFGGPDGGNGGRGGDVIIQPRQGRNTLLDFTFNRVMSAKNGQHGRGDDCYGKKGEDLILTLPVGTEVYNEDTGELIIDVVDPEKKILLIPGGAGGLGNTAFATPTDKAPNKFSYGEIGKTLHLRLELKLLADVGIVGFPNVGKSTFINQVSRSKAKVADYPFTTLAPNLGVVKMNDYSDPIVVADLPGLIEGASDGIGLGHQFLKHMERCRMIAHFVDATAGFSDEEDAIKHDTDEFEHNAMIARYKIIREELRHYSVELYDKPEVIVATKLDSADPDILAGFRKFVENQGKELFCVSSFSEEGINELLLHIYDKLSEHDS